MSLNQQIIYFIFSPWVVFTGLLLPLVYLIYKIIYFLVKKKREPAKKHIVSILALIFFMLPCLLIMGFDSSGNGVKIVLSYFLTFIALLIVGGRLGI